MWRILSYEGHSVAYEAAPDHRGHARLSTITTSASWGLEITLPENLAPPYFDAIKAVRDAVRLRCGIVLDIEQPENTNAMRFTLQRKPSFPALRALARDLMNLEVLLPEPMPRLWEQELQGKWIPEEHKCLHAEVKTGPNIPRRYGSWRSEICCACGAWRTMGHTEPYQHVSDWHAADEITYG